MSLSAVLLQIVLPLSILLLASLVVLGLMLLHRYQRRTFFERYREVLSSLRIEKVGKLLTKINGTTFNSRANHERISKLEMVYDQLDQALVKAGAHLKLVSAKLFPWTRRAKIALRNELDEQVAIVDFLEKKFNVISATLITQDEQLRDQFIRYQAIMRQAIEVYAYKKVLLEQVNTELEVKLAQIAEREVAFNKVVTEGDIKTASKLLKIYAAQVSDFLHVIDTSPALHTYIYQIIPDLISKLSSAYKARVQTLPSVYVISDLEATIKLISQPYRELRVAFSALQVDRAMTLVRKVLVALKALEQQVNYESAAHELLVKRQAEVIAQAEQALMRYDEFKLQLEILFGKGYVVPRELSEANHDAQRAATSLRSELQFFTNQSAASSSFLNSARLERAKVVVESANRLMVSLNNLNSLFWVINTEMISLRRKYRRIEAAFSEVAANIKRYNISLSAAEMAQQSALREALDALAQKLKVDFSTDALKQSVAHLGLEVATFYQAINASIHIAEMASNLLRDFAPLRAVEAKLDHDFILAERLYMEGKYTEALSSIVKRLEERVH